MFGYSLDLTPLTDSLEILWNPTLIIVKVSGNRKVNKIKWRKKLFIKVAVLYSTQSSRRRLLENPFNNVRR